MNYYFDVLKKYAEFNGRARRAEYWYFVLFNFIIAILLNLILSVIHLRALAFLYSLAVLIPAIAVGARRLHDTDRTGWWLLLGLIPIIGDIILIVWMATDSDAGDNQYGPNPKGVIAVSATPHTN